MYFVSARLSQLARGNVRCHLMLDYQIKILSDSVLTLYRSRIRVTDLVRPVIKDSDIQALVALICYRTLTIQTSDVGFKSK